MDNNITTTFDEAVHYVSKKDTLTTKEQINDTLYDLIDAMKKNHVNMDVIQIKYLEKIDNNLQRIILLLEQINSK